jgi:hypothetical protein
MDTKKLHQQARKRVSLSELSRLGCNRNILFQGLMRYTVCETQAHELRSAFAEARITKAQLDQEATAGRQLAGFLERLQRNPRIWAANDPPKIGPGGSMPIPVLRDDLLKTADWLESVVPFRPDSTEAVIALALHAEESTGKRQLRALADLLNKALRAAGLPDSITPGSIKMRFARADETTREKAKKWLTAWAALP